MKTKYVSLDVNELNNMIDELYYIFNWKIFCIVGKQIFLKRNTQITIHGQVKEGNVQLAPNLNQNYNSVRVGF